MEPFLPEAKLTLDSTQLCVCILSTIVTIYIYIYIYIYINAYTGAKPFIQIQKLPTFPAIFESMYVVQNQFSKAVLVF